ncbi:thiol:disulfide interchange protein DsbC [Desulfuromonas versatilis]|uniref:Thiol:disulfide interchange protein DsbC n=1 Tax=Desulfuromonas versatilis TaxID=2802975 RepID=A0ABM8HUV0_9BACT|nr:DsbC family protein [Desulfuromonas versatilis]BCR04489.1 thiol:disulfide interchange protein DsbC [Desulfuromonas versatilis]
MRFLFCAILLLLAAGPALAMNGDGCGAGKCNDCHSMSLTEAKDLLQAGVDQVNSVDFSELPGLFVVEVEKQGQKFPIYVDFSKQYVISGNIIRLKDKQNITQQRKAELNRVDLSRIPLDDALLLGSAKASKKVVVFTDPECPYCKKLHPELQEVVKRDPDIAFLIKLFPLKMHPNAYQVSQSIVCAKSMAMLESSFAGKTIPPPACKTGVVDQTLALVEDLGIRSTPTLVLPDGLVLPGYKQADQLLQILGSKVAAEAPAK